MTKREKELLLLLAETDLKNLKIILRLKESTASQEEIDALLDKIWNVMPRSLKFTPFIEVVNFNALVLRSMTATPKANYRDLSCLPYACFVGTQTTVCKLKPCLHG